MQPLPYERRANPGSPTGDPPPPPPRAFTQGVGTVFQFVGVLLFLGTMFICCGSSFLSRDVAERKDWSASGWGRRADGTPVYSIARAVTVSVTVNAVLAIGLAGFGLGLQAERRQAPMGAAVVGVVGAVFWTVHAAFFVQYFHPLTLGVLACVLAMVFMALSALAVGAWREVRRNPPPPGHELLPADYKVPYSHFHEDPPEVRLAAEMEQRRRRLEVQQKELEALEERIRRHRQEPR